MQLIGLGTAVLFLASLASFMMAFMNPERVSVGTTLGALFFLAASVILAVMIWRRNKTEYKVN